MKLNEKLIGIFLFDIVVKLRVFGKSKQGRTVREVLEVLHATPGWMEIFHPKPAECICEVKWVTSSVVGWVSKAPLRLNLLDVLPFIGDTANKSTHGMSAVLPLVPRLWVLVAGEDKQFGDKLHMTPLCVYIKGGGIAPLEKFGETATSTMPFVEYNNCMLSGVIAIEPSPSRASNGDEVGMGRITHVGMDGLTTSRVSPQNKDSWRLSTRLSSGRVVMAEETMVLCNGTEELGVTSQVVGRTALIKLSLG